MLMCLIEKVSVERCFIFNRRHPLHMFDTTTADSGLGYHMAFFCLRVRERKNRRGWLAHDRSPRIKGHWMWRRRVRDVTSRALEALGILILDLAERFVANGSYSVASCAGLSVPRKMTDLPSTNNCDRQFSCVILCLKHLQTEIRLAPAVHH